MLLATSGASGLFLHASPSPFPMSSFEMSGLSMSNAADIKHVRWCGAVVRCG